MYLDFLVANTVMFGLSMGWMQACRKVSLDLDLYARMSVCNLYSHETQPLILKGTNLKTHK